MDAGIPPPSPELKFDPPPLSPLMRFLQGVIHWNKIHASVLMNRRLLEAVGGFCPPPFLLCFFLRVPAHCSLYYAFRAGGYDPGLPWGLEDWNFWLSSLSHAPVVRFSPSLTFYYRQHKVRTRTRTRPCCPRSSLLALYPRERVRETRERERERERGERESIGW